jgi:hypothetical protein
MYVSAIVMELSTYQDLQDLNTEANWTQIVEHGLGISDPISRRLFYAYTTMIKCTPNNPIRTAFHQHICSIHGIKDVISVADMMEDTRLLIEQRRASFVPRKEGEPAPICEFCL